MHAPQFWILNQPSLSPRWRIGKVVSMIRKTSGSRGSYMQMLLLVSIPEPLYCELKVSVRRARGEIPIRVERFTATHLMRCFLKHRFVHLLLSLSIMHCNALYLSSFFLIHARYCMYGSFKEVPF